MKKKTLIPAIVFILISIFVIKSSFFENKKNLKYSQLSKQNSFLSGEWYDAKDSASGISVRGNKMAFFKNSQFNGEEVYEYKLIDSINE